MAGHYRLIGRELRKDDQRTRLLVMVHFVLLLHTTEGKPERTKDLVQSVIVYVKHGRLPSRADWQPQQSASRYRTRSFCRVIQLHPYHATVDRVADVRPAIRDGHIRRPGQRDVRLLHSRTRTAAVLV